jgi:hypothetical protein
VVIVRETAEPLSIEACVPQSGKIYLGDLASAGLEWGLGSAGVYAGHAHLGFTDVLFSPRGLVIRTQDGLRHRVVLFLCGPRTFFEPEQLPNFWFLKFYSTAGDSAAGLPDKLVSPEESAPARYVALGSGTMSCRYFDPRDCSSSDILFCVSPAPDAVLEVSVGGNRLISVGR